MARPMKRRRVCCLPGCSKFGPLDVSTDSTGSIEMTVDEYEAIRLIDLENLTQEECGEHMDVARSTIQNIYGEARKKLADSLVNGKTLVIEGGKYRFCNGDHGRNRGCGCHRKGKVKGKCSSE
ncbi:MAG: DUF134 domain-containing protein [Methanosarcinaceae archaeon]|nr:DUF134 domain-containing protein [Methanosarcinaceae archaeon]